jgi:hypothetical protein
MTLRCSSGERSRLLDHLHCDLRPFVAFFGGGIGAGGRLCGGRFGRERQQYAGQQRTAETGGCGNGEKAAAGRIQGRVEGHAEIIALASSHSARLCSALSFAICLHHDGAKIKAFGLREKNTAVEFVSEKLNCSTFR